MGRFDYKFVEVPFDGNLKTGSMETFQRCKEIIMNEAADGWRLIQIISPAGEKSCPPAWAVMRLYLKRKTKKFSFSLSFFRTLLYNEYVLNTT